VEGGTVTDDQWTAFIAWKAMLSRDEQDECDYIAKLQGGNHATAYLAVRLMRAERVASELGEQMMELAHRSVWKDGAKAAGALAAAAAALFAGWKGAR
jgi:hypothetical protein